MVKYDFRLKESAYLKVIAAILSGRNEIVLCGVIELLYILNTFQENK